MADDLIAKILSEPRIFGEEIEEFEHRGFIWTPYTTGELQIVLAKPFIDEGYNLRELIHKERKEYNVPELHVFYRMLMEGTLAKDMIIHINGKSDFGLKRAMGSSWAPAPVRLDVRVGEVSSDELGHESSIELENPRFSITPLEQYNGTPAGFAASYIVQMSREQGIPAVDMKYFR